jgi:hypothetical protein
MSYETGLSMEERVSSLFQPDTLLPDQYFDTFRRKFQLEPEKKLMLAILEDAVACFQKYMFTRDGKGKALFREAEQWIEGNGKDGIFAFDSVCEMLGFDPDYLRRGLAVWKDKARSQHPQVKIYRLAPRQKKPKRGVPMSGRSRSHQRMRRAAGR